MRIWIKLWIQVLSVKKARFWARTDYRAIEMNWNKMTSFCCFSSVQLGRSVRAELRFANSSARRANPRYHRRVMNGASLCSELEVVDYGPLDAWRQSALTELAWRRQWLCIWVTAVGFFYLQIWNQNQAPVSCLLFHSPLFLSHLSPYFPFLWFISISLRVPSSPFCFSVKRRKFRFTPLTKLTPPFSIGRKLRPPGIKIKSPEWPCTDAPACHRFVACHRRL